MKVFISHKDADSSIAREIKARIERNGAEAYLDVLDNVLYDGQALTNHIKERISECTDILVIISNLTERSWWVPFEIGIASEKDFPIVNYLQSGIRLPDYLSYWPKLIKLEQIDQYVLTKRKIDLKGRISNYDTDLSSAEESLTNIFYRTLKEQL